MKANEAPAAATPSLQTQLQTSLEELKEALGPTPAAGITGAIKRLESLMKRVEV